MKKYLDSLGKYEEAFEVFDKVLLINNNYYEIINRCLALFEEKKYKYLIELIKNIDGLSNDKSFRLYVLNEMRYMNYEIFILH